MVPLGLRMPIWKINFCSSVLRLAELPKCKERRQNSHIFFRMFREIKNIGAKVIYTRHFSLPRRGGGVCPVFFAFLAGFSDFCDSFFFFDKIRGGGGGPPGLFPQIRHCGHRKNESAFQVVLRNSWRYTFLVLWVLPLATRLLKTCRYIEVSVWWLTRI